MARQRNHAPDFKDKVALAALSGNKTVAGGGITPGMEYKQEVKRATVLKL